MNTVQLSLSDSKIVGVNLYPNRAEITRSYKLSAKRGQNQIHITWLPWVLEENSLRVEGRGNATIHDVNLKENLLESQIQRGDALEELDERKVLTEKAIGRCKKSIASLENFLGTLNTEHTKSSDLSSVMNDYDTSAEKLDDRLLELEKQLKEVEKKIEEEKKRLAPKKPYERGRNASIGVVADTDGDIELILIYAVRGAIWKAGYDIRVDTSSTEKPVTLIYKAIIEQRTGEPWDNVPLTLETATPTYGVNLPTLDQWTVGIYQPKPAVYGSIAKSRGLLRTKSAFAANDDDEMLETMDYATASVTSKGNISATFRVPGMVSIPSEQAERSFTIVELQLSALMTWFSVPKVDSWVHLKAKIYNESDYTLLAGNASVYVDGSFISKSNVPPVSPQEHFDCPLGLDPSVRITYHPLSKKISSTGFYSKSTNHVYVQRLTVHNTKTSRIALLKIVDHIPVSDNSEITVKLVHPSLNLPIGKQPTASIQRQAPSAGAENDINEGASNKRLSIFSGGSTLKPSGSTMASLPDIVASSAGPNVNLSKGVIAQWDGADEPEGDIDALGKNGKINWLCNIPPQEKVNLTLQWEVCAPAKTQMTGL